jgi:hypothetical protein
MFVKGTTTLQEAYVAANAPRVAEEETGPGEVYALPF